MCRQFREKVKEFWKILKNRNAHFAKPLDIETSCNFYKELNEMNNSLSIYFLMTLFHSAVIGEIHNGHCLYFKNMVQNGK